MAPGMGNLGILYRLRRKLLSTILGLQDTQKLFSSRVVELPIPSTGTLRLTEFPNNLHVEPVNPFEAKQNKITVAEELRKLTDQAEKVLITREEGVVTFKVPESHAHLRDHSFHVQIPVKYNVDISMGSQGSVTLEKIESEDIAVKTVHGSICLKNTKAISNNLVSKFGDIVFVGSVYGSCHLVTKAPGNIRIAKIQGEKAHFEGSEDVEVEDMYCEKFTSTLVRGLKVKNFHGAAELIGHYIELRSVLGSFNITASDVMVGIDKLLADSNIVSEGNVRLDLSNQVNVKLVLCAPHIEIDYDLDIIDHHKPGNGKEIITCGISATPSHSVQINSSTQIVIKKADWFQNLNLV